MSARGSVGIIGGGLLGLTTAYRLACEGVKVAVYESSPELGGLAGSVDLDGTRIDRYYHVVLPTDDRVRGLAGELGLEDRFRFRHTRVGFYQAGRVTSMSSLPELLTFPGLRAVDRVRLGAFVARCQLKGGYDDLEQTPLEEWLRRNGGDRMWENLWQPLLDSKFDGRYDDLPATYLWARTRRMSSTRDRSSREVMGTLEGGYQVLVDALAAAIRERGGEIHTSTAVRFVASSRGRAFGVVLDTGLRAHDWVVTTQLRPNLVAMPGDLKAAIGPDPCRYLGVVCLVARVRRSISPYYAINITDRRIPLTTVVETTHVVDPEKVGGTLLYIPKYVNPDSPELERPSGDIRRDYLSHAQQIFPALERKDVLAMQVARARVAEPVHVLGGVRAPALCVAPGLAVASSAHVYPDLVNGQAVIKIADQLAAELSERLPAHADATVQAA